MNDLTIIYYTANKNKDYFMANTQRILLDAVGDTPIVSVSFKPTVIGPNCTNICIGEHERGNYLLYSQILTGTREAKTKYVAMAEDDMLYAPEHFAYRPPDEDTFSYDFNKWSVFSWVRPAIFSYRPRKLMNSLITTKNALLKTLEERYAKYPVFENIPHDIYKYYWGEPGRFEDHLGITHLKSESYFSPVPNIMFSTSEALAFLHFGTRKTHSEIRKNEVPPWGTAEEVLKQYYG